MITRKLSKLILDLVEKPRDKVFLEVGSHDDKLTLELSTKFKQIFSYYEYLKIPERVENNINIKKMPYLKVLEEFNKFNVIFLEDEFRHFPGIWQMWTYNKLMKGQELLLKEWNFTGNNEHFYISFQNYKPLCKLTREILNRFVEKKVIKIVKKINSKDETRISSKKEMIDYYKFKLPDHWEFGKEEFLNKIKNLTYPLVLWEGFDLFKIEKI